MLNSEFFSAQQMDADDLEGVEYLAAGDMVKAVVHLACGYFDAHLLAGETVYDDAFNAREPFDALTHIFYIPRETLTEGETLRFAALDSASDGDRCVCSFPYAAQFADEDALYRAYDSEIEPVQTVRETIAPGLFYNHMLCRDRDGKPVQMFLLEAQSGTVSFTVGTPNDGYAGSGCSATVPDMIKAAEQHGKRVLVAVNADFFDMFGDSSPSGLCVKDGKVVANADSTRPFFGVLHDGTPVIASLGESPHLLTQLSQAAAGLQWLLRDGKALEWGPLEPFAYVRHPRTAIGIRADGTVLLLVADGRIPDYSNGATLVDLIRMMQRLGAVQALNMDGGGSSIVYTRSGERQRLRSNPADLYRPLDKLIRPCFNCILVTENNPD